jgi:hypothetical protein
MTRQKQPAEPPMTLGNMRELGVQNLVASCLNDACRHVALTDVSSYSADTEVPWFRSRVVSAKCGSRGNKIEVKFERTAAERSLPGKVWRHTPQSPVGQALSGKVLFAALVNKYKRSIGEGGIFDRFIVICEENANKMLS